MAYKYVYFHKMEIYKRNVKTNRESNDVLEKIYFSTKDLDEKVTDIMENHLIRHCIILEQEDQQITLELLNVTDEYIYARIGRMRDIATVHLRNKHTLEATPITKKDGQEFEIFTYVYIDRSNYVISFIHEQGAPSIQKLGNLIGNVYGETENVFSEITSIMIEDAIPLLKKKEQIGTILYKVSVPPDERINIDELGLTEDQFEALDNQKSIDIEVKLVAERNQDAIPDRSKFDTFIKNIINITRRVKVKAKDSNEYMQTYNIVGNPLTKKVKIDFTYPGEEMNKEIERQLRKVYLDHKNEILKYVKGD